MSANDITNEPVQSPVTDTLSVNRGRVFSVTIYDVKESELEVFEQGSPSSIYLNFSIFLLSTGISFLSSILVSDFENERTFIVFVIVAIVGLVLGALLLSIWFVQRKKTKNICKTIRARASSSEV